MKAHVKPSCHLVFSVCGYWRGFIIMRSYNEISAERSQAFWKRLNLYGIKDLKVMQNMTLWPVQICCRLKMHKTEKTELDCHVLSTMTYICKHPSAQEPKHQNDGI